MSEVVVKEIDGTSYMLKLFDTMVGLKLMQRLQTEGFSPEVIRDAIMKGCSIGSVGITEIKFNKHFQGKYTPMMELFAEILKYNNFPGVENGEEGNEEGSEE